MLLLITGLLALGLILTLRRYRAQKQALGLLARSVRARNPFLNENDGSGDREWESLREASNALIDEFNRIDRQRSSQLTQLEVTLRSLQEAVLVIDRDNYILLANKALKNIFDTGNTVVGQRVETVLPSADFLDFLNEVRGGAKSGSREIEFSKEGGAIWIEATGTEIPNLDDPAPAWTLFVLHDISRLKRLEFVRKEFVANVSHELKTPLSVITGYLETLVDDHECLPAADRLHFLRTAQRNCLRLNLLLEDLLRLSRLESRRPDIQLMSVNLTAWLESIIPDLRPRVEATGHRLLVDLPAGALPVRMDAFRISQVIENLLDNAQNYSDSGTGIRLGAGPVGESVELWVMNEGPGIPGKDLPHIFERFYRADKGRSRETGGTGLGLSIVKHIAELHGGTVRAESRQGETTRIVVSLPSGGPNAGEG